MKIICERSENSGVPFMPSKLTAFLKENSGQVISVSKIDQIFKQEARIWFESLPSQKSKELIAQWSLKKTTNSAIEPPIGWEPGDPVPDIIYECAMLNAYLGTDCGCCGNYSGLCYLCSLACYLHDITCQLCIPVVYCLPGCVPGPCTNL